MSQRLSIWIYFLQVPSQFLRALGSWNICSMFLGTFRHLHAAFVVAASGLLAAGLLLLRCPAADLQVLFCCRSSSWCSGVSLLPLARACLLLA